jgi:hypothetical protein
MIGFQYTMAARLTMYKGVEFRSRLEARWAAFFDLLGWTWEYEPIDLVFWTPDFRLTIPGLDFEAMADYSDFLVEVKPYYHNSQWEGHPVTLLNPVSDFLRAETNPPGWGCMALGVNPAVSRVSLHFHEYDEYSGPLCGMGVCSKGGPENINVVTSLFNNLWIKAGNITRWYPQ